MPTINIPFLVGEKRLLNLIEKIKPWCNDTGLKIRIIDNSCSIDCLHGVEIFHPPIPMGFSATQNMIQKLTLDAGEPFALFCHDDAVPTREAAEKVLAAAVSGKNWGTIFTMYDAFAAYSSKAIKAAGRWDENIPWYGADNDWYRRVYGLGFVKIDVGACGCEHTPSSTVKSDWRVRFDCESVSESVLHYYMKKWGGGFNEEKFLLPWNGDYLTPGVKHFTESETFNRLTAAHTINEGTLLERQDDPEILAQIRTIAWAYQVAGSPVEVLEIGTAKGFFAMVLNSLNPKAELTTCDLNPKSSGPAAIMSEKMVVRFFNMKSAEFWRCLPIASQPGFAWIDGGHDYNTAKMDTSEAMNIGIGMILVDDFDMVQVRQAVMDCVGDSSYELIESPFKPKRQIAILKRR